MISLIVQACEGALIDLCTEEGVPIANPDAMGVLALIGLVTVVYLGYKLVRAVVGAIRDVNQHHREMATWKDDQ